MQQMMRYRIGTNNHWPNATIFWQIDQQQKVHTGKIMLYDYHTDLAPILKHEITIIRFTRDFFNLLILESIE